VVLASPLGLPVTVNACPVDTPVVGLTDNQFPVLLVEVEKVSGKLPPMLLETVTASEGIDDERLIGDGFDDNVPFPVPLPPIVRLTKMPGAPGAAYTMAE
jgi:hypothetical protein